MTDRQRRFGPGWLALVVTVLAYALLQSLMSTRVINLYWQQIASLAGITAISALGLNLVYGYTGQFSLGHAAFYGMGAYASALVTGRSSPGWWPS
jgi:branched-chain amino acid transport system permease protein